MGGFVSQAPAGALHLTPLGDAVPQTPWPGPRHANPLHCKVMGTPMPRRIIFLLWLSCTSYFQSYFRGGQAEPVQ